jgi:surfactin synthase thioesterase subunit
MLHGKQDKSFPVRIARQQAKLLKQRLPPLQYRECQGDHFFLLSGRKVTCDAIKAFMAQR